MFCKAKSAKKTFFLRGDFRLLPNKNVQMLDHFFPLLFPKNSESLKIFDIPLREVGAKRPLNGTSKVNRHTNRKTDRQTDRQTDISTYRKHRPRGPMLWKPFPMVLAQIWDHFSIVMWPKQRAAGHRSSPLPRRPWPCPGVGLGRAHARPRSGDPERTWQGAVAPSQVLTNWLTKTMT